LLDKSIISAAGIGGYFMFSKGLAKYRGGQFAAAATIMAGPASITYQPAPTLVHAMAEYKLGNVDRARALYSKALAKYDWNQPHTVDHQFWMFELLRSEADSLINASKTGP
jgi:hypothetical protein